MLALVVLSIFKPLLARQAAIGHRGDRQGVAGARGFRPGGLSNGNGEWSVRRPHSSFATRHSPLISMRTLSE